MPQADLIHLLRRTGFGPTAGDLASFAGLERADAVTQVLDMSANPGVVMPSTITRTDTYYNMVDLQQWWWERMRTSPTPLLEKLTLFWHGHFASSEDKVFDPLKMWNQNQVLRTNALGGFEDLFQAVAIDPAMLIYLDNAENYAGVANENFARESMELFSLGVDQYTQSDVTASAAAWTGYNLDALGQYFLLDPARHDNSQKTFFGITQNWDGPQIITEICTGAKQETCASFIASELWSYFAYPNPDPTLLGVLVDALLSTGLNIASLLSVMFNRDEFYGASAQGALVRSPTDFMVSAMRCSGFASSKANPQWYANEMGQSIFYPTDVSGWHGNPAFVSTAAAQAKAGYAQNLGWQYTNANLPTGYAATPAATAVNQMLTNLGVFSPSGSTLNALTSWAASVDDPNWGRFYGLFVLSLLSPEFSLA